jgi:hypothetical protein
MKVDKIILSSLMSFSVWAQNSTTTLTPNSSVLTSPVAAKEEKAVNYTGAIKVTTLGRSIEDESMKSTVGWSFVELGVDAKYFEWLKFSFNMLAAMGEGAAQNYLTGDGAGANAIMIDSVGVEVNPIKQVSLKAGIIGYKINPLLTTMSAGTSLGAEQSLNLANSAETLKLSFIGNEAIPSTGVTKGMVEEEKNPFFISGSVQAEAKLNPIKTTFKAAATQFKFGNLPMSASQGALTGGNSIKSVSGVGDKMQYVIGFAGIESAGVIETEWTSKLTSTLKAAVIQNDRAFEDSNKGTLGNFNLKYKSGNATYTPSVTVFEVQADTTPAPFSILINRYNNRKGQKVSFSVDLEKQKLGFFGSYTKSEEIVASPFMSDREIYNLGVEVNYDLF